jgi:drug/metabolite transporter (DMT)-like permease
MNYTNLLLTLFIAFLSGVLPVIHKHLLKKFNPMSILIFSGVTYFTVLVLFMFTQMDQLKKDISKLTTVDLLWVLAGSIGCVFLSNIIYYHVLQNNKSYLVSALIDCAPVFTLLFAILFLKEQITKLSILGIIFIISGVICISIGDAKLEDFDIRF